ncbi:MAG: C-type lectin domain-containing protein [Promethearchaeota archaeon]
MSRIKENQGLLNSISYSDGDSIFCKSLNPKVTEQNIPERGFNDHTYELIPIRRSWSAARDDCESRRGHLVTITSQGENNMVRHLIEYESVWIGFTDEGIEGSWRWITGESVTYINWADGEPNDSGGEDYVELYESGEWNDLSGLEELYYICEWDSTHNITTPTVIFPNGGETLEGIINVLWSASTDSYDHHDVTYKVSYSIDNGVNWNLITKEVVATNYEWDTSTIPEGTSFLIKVVAKCSQGKNVEDISDGSFFVHYLTRLTLLSPHQGDRLRGISILKWSESTDSLGYAVTYSVFFSIDNGMTWDSLVTGLMTNNYNWNTSKFADGRYKIKIRTISSEGLTTEYITEGTFLIDNILTDITLIVLGLALLMIFPELFFSRKLSNVLSRKRIEIVEREEGVGQP